MKIKNPSDVKLNHWYTYCCHLDLWEILDQEELEDIRERLSDDEPPCPEVWETQQEALLEIRSRLRDPEAIAEIDAMLAKIEAIDPDVVVVNLDEYTTITADTIDGFLDVESFNEGSVTLKTKDETVTIPYPDSDTPSVATLKDGSKIVLL